MFRVLKRLLRWVLLALLGGVLTLVAFNVWLVLRSADRVTVSNAAEAPGAQVALVMGTSKKLEDGRTNLFWKGRMDAAAALYKAGKVRQILVSGDNRSAYYNEPRDMRDGLVQRGVPSEVITLDFAGLRTLDSVIRAHEIFGVTDCVIITDDFHLPRSLWLADRRGLRATGFCGRPLSWKVSAGTRLREWMARINAGLDEWVLGTGAKMYGKPEKLKGGFEVQTVERRKQPAEGEG